MYFSWLEETVQVHTVQTRAVRFPLCVKILLARAQSVIGREALDASRRLIEFFSHYLTQKDALLRTRPPRRPLSARGYAYTCTMAKCAASAVFSPALPWIRYYPHYMSFRLSFFRLSSGSAARRSPNANSFSPATSSLSYVRKFPTKETNYEWWMRSSSSRAITARSWETV